MFFAVLPTGFGKSLCYARLPLAFDKFMNSHRRDPSYAKTRRSGYAQLGTSRMGSLLLSFGFNCTLIKFRSGKVSSLALRCATMINVRKCDNYVHARPRVRILELHSLSDLD